MPVGAHTKFNALIGTWQLTLSAMRSQDHSCSMVAIEPKTLGTQVDSQKARQEQWVFRSRVGGSKMHRMHVRSR